MSGGGGEREFIDDTSNNPQRGMIRGPTKLYSLRKSIKKKGGLQGGERGREGEREAFKEF